MSIEGCPFAAIGCLLTQHQQQEGADSCEGTEEEETTHTEGV